MVWIPDDEYAALLARIDRLEGERDTARRLAMAWSVRWDRLMEGAYGPHWRARQLAHERSQEQRRQRRRERSGA